MTNVAIFASGGGTNAQKILEHFKNHPSIQVKLILSNKPDAFVLERAKTAGIETAIFNKEQFNDGSVLQTLKENNISYIVLAGFLWLIPSEIISAFQNRIINIHPALLPLYGGKGMYGHFVHKAVIENKEKASGISIHLVNSKYDEGKILFQAKCEITQEDTPETLSKKVQELEHLHFPKVIENYILGNHESEL